MTDFDGDMDSRDDECPDVWHLGLPGDNDRRCPVCGWCEECGVSCDCSMI